MLELFGSMIIIRTIQALLGEVLKTAVSLLRLGVGRENGREALKCYS